MAAVAICSVWVLLTLQVIAEDRVDVVAVAANEDKPDICVVETVSTLLVRCVVPVTLCQLSEVVASYRDLGLSSPRSETLVIFPTALLT